MFFLSRRTAVAVFSLFIFFVFLSHTSNGQDLDQSSIAGRVVDSTGSAVSGASIETVPIGNGTFRATESSSDGGFVLTELMSGIYRVRVSKSGFDPQFSEIIVLLSPRAIRMMIALRASGISEEVTIRPDAKHRIEVERVALGSSVSARELSLIPISSRDPIDLLFLLPGVAEEPLGTRNLAEDEGANHRATPLEQGIASIGGGASYSNNFTIDGLDNNDDRTARERFSPPIDSLEEIQVTTNQYSAEYGRASGGRVNFRTRTGSSLLSGSMGFRIRDDRLDANTWRNKQRGFDRPRLRERRPSLTLGGPLGGGGSRTFFFIAYEHSILEDTTIIDTYVPIAGNPAFRLPSPTSNEIVCEVADQSSCAGNSPSAAWMSPFVEHIETPDTSHALNLRVDRRLGNNGDLSVGIQLGKRTGRRSAGDSVTRMSEAMQRRSVDSEAVNLSLSRALGTKTVVDFKAQWSRLRPSYRSDRPDDPVVLISYRNPFTDSSQTLVAGNATASTLQNFSDTRVESRKQLQGGATAVIGNSVIRFGADFQGIDSFAKSLSDTSGTFNFASFLRFASGSLARFRQNFGTDSVVRNTYTGVYGMNEIRLAENLNLSIGLRYESEAAVEDRDNFGPRIGIAWDPASSGRSVIRAGFGVFYNRVLLRTIADYARSERSDLAFFDSNLIGSSASDVRRGAVLAAIAPRFPSGFRTSEELRGLIQTANCGSATVPAPCSPDLGFAGKSTSVPERRIDGGIGIPHSIVWSASYELSLGSKASLEISFSSNSARGLWRERNLNLPVLPTGYSNWTEFLVGNPFVFRNSNGSVRTYFFYLGDPSIGGSISTSPGGSANCSSTANVTCHVNLNSFSSSATRPSTASPSSGNSIGGPIGIALAAIDRFRPIADAGDVSSISSVGASDSRSLTVSLRSGVMQRSGFGISGRLSYSIGSQMDDGLNNTSDAEVDSDFRREYAPSLSHRRHRVAEVGLIESPRYLGGVSSSLAFRYGSAAPFNIGIGSDRNLDGSTTDRPNHQGRTSDIRWRRPGSDFPAALLASFSLPPIGSRSGNLPRNAGSGPSTVSLDFALSRSFQIGERLVLRPGVEAGNILNLTGFSFGAEYINFNALGPDATPNQMAALENFLVPPRTTRPRELRVTLLVRLR